VANGSGTANPLDGLMAGDLAADCRGSNKGASAEQRNRHPKLDVFELPDCRRDSALEAVMPDLRWLVDRRCNLVDGGVHVNHGS
jgi:hypothetical protein